MAFEMTRLTPENIPISVLVFGETKTGKTRLANTLPLDSTLFCNVETNMVSLYGSGIVKTDVVTWGDMENVVQNISSLNPRPKWIFIDSGTKLGEVLLREECQKVNDNRLAYVETEMKLKELIPKIKNMGINVVMTAYMSKLQDGMTGQMKYGAEVPGAKFSSKFGYLFDACVATRIVDFDDAKQSFVIQCIGDDNYSCGVRQALNANNVINKFEKPDLLSLYRKITEIKEETQTSNEGE